MIRLEANKMAKAIEKARRLRPRVIWLGGRDFKVIGASGDSYKVSFAVANGVKLGGCNCAAGQSGMVCYHLASAAQVNIIVQSARRQAMAA